MKFNVSESKWIEYASPEAYVSFNELKMLEQAENIEITGPKRSTSSESSLKVPDDQNVPHFYELKIRVRKYDFL